LVSLIQEGVLEAKKTAIDRIKNEKGLKDFKDINTNDKVDPVARTGGARKIWNKRGAGFETVNFEQKVAIAKANYNLKKQ